MIDWSFIALLFMFGILGISVLGYLAWEDYIYFKITKTAIDKALDAAKGDKHDMDK